MRYRTDQPAPRLDRLIAQLTGRSRQQARALLEAGAVTLAGRRCTPRDAGKPVPPGSDLLIDDAADVVVPDASLPLTVLAQGDDWVAVDKLPGVPVHPLLPGEAGTLLHAVSARFPQVLEVTPEGPMRAGVVHRLDVPTSGVVLFARSMQRYTMLRDAFREHRIDKRYRAVVRGVPSMQAEELVMDLAVTRHRPARVEVVSQDHADARRCTLRYRVLQAQADRSLVEIELVTGFLHQARVMMAQLGHAILGDRDYAPTTVADAAPRLMLHAHRIRIADIDATSPVPEGFEVQPSGSSSSC